MSDFDFVGELFGMVGASAEKLDESWRKACATGNFRNYNALVENTKITGAKVYRNDKTGKHKVVR